MQKKFYEWGLQKQTIEKRAKRLYVNEAEVWWCSVGVNICKEVCGKGNYFTRPVLILKKLSRELFIGLPLTTAEKEGSWFFNAHWQDGKSTVMLNQIRCFDVSRLRNREGTFSATEFHAVKEKLKTLLELF